MVQRILSCVLPFLLCFCSSAVAQPDTSPPRYNTRTSPWHLPSVTLDDGVIRVWNSDTLLNDLEMVSVFVSGKEFSVAHDDLVWLATRYHYDSVENGVLVRRRAIRPVISIPLRAFYLVDDHDEKSFLYTTARPDSLHMVGVVTNGDWFFQRMLLGDGEEYAPVSWYYQKRSGAIYCDPPDHAPPWKYMRKKEADL